jgi:hypothetical protein
MMARASVFNSPRVAALVTAQRGKGGAALAREMQHAPTHHADVADTDTTQRATEWRHGRNAAKWFCDVGSQR